MQRRHALVTPYLYTEWGKDRLKELSEGGVDFGGDPAARNGFEPRAARRRRRGALGRVRGFQDAEVTVEKVLASCALPTLVSGPVRIGENVVYRDGLFSQNPPIRDFINRYKHIEVRKIEMLRELDASSWIAALLSSARSLPTARSRPRGFSEVRTTPGRHP